MTKIGKLRIFMKLVPGWRAGLSGQVTVALCPQPRLGRIHEGLHPVLGQVDRPVFVQQGEVVYELVAALVHD